MKRQRTHRATPNPFIVWTQLAVKTSEMMITSAQVIHHRAGRIVTAGALPSERDRREFTLMGQEKLEAVVESAQAVATRTIIIYTQIGTLGFRQLLNSTTGLMNFIASPAALLSASGQADLLRGAIDGSSAMASQLSSALARLAHHGLKPIHTRVTGNAKRLLGD
ncbi:MAG TPA: polyhydroxyalkanoate granule-associated phasin [Noviherbaspirillum sp.]|uniref:polyhydroxyalkanoate granule-associated phasin n=1 Tax=Noviherbaspirillum sp. TaxID=1926288 RepID=UPI002B45CA6E|nr:polyhydroxyalkanoate granule-associated phasin [Noviherbaspirillum sp.]HJV85577.1 polyhydroxyalkanoate granule-associated phasin [Noviherbaspirillum sp.]